MNPLYAISRNPSAPNTAIVAACDAILTHSVQHPYDYVLHARQIKDALKGMTDDRP